MGSPRSCCQEPCCWHIERIFFPLGGNGSIDISNSFRRAFLSSLVRWCRRLVPPPLQEGHYLSSQQVSRQLFQGSGRLSMSPFLPPFHIGFVTVDILGLWSRTVQWREQLVINIFETLPAVKALVVSTDPPRCSFFFFSPISSFRWSFREGFPETLIFSDVFACSRLINFLPVLEITVTLLSSLLYMNKSIYWEQRNVGFYLLITPFLLSSVLSFFFNPLHLVFGYVLSAEMQHTLYFKGFWGDSI